MSEPDSVDVIEVIPREILDAADDVIYNAMPDKSKKIYKQTLKEFRVWMAEKNTNSYDEKVLLAYFKHLSSKNLPSTLWSKYSMLNTMLKIATNINIVSYFLLRGFLKKLNVGYRAKKSKIFTSDEIKKFIADAPNDRYLEVKVNINKSIYLFSELFSEFLPARQFRVLLFCLQVAIILGITGACRRNELYQLTVENITDKNTHLIVDILDTKTHIDRTFTVNNPFREIIVTYMRLRPSNVTTTKFFLNYQKGKCTKQPIGINKLGAYPYKVAEWLELPDPKLYTGHSFRRTSATLLANAGASMGTLKRHGGWKSAKIAEGYIEESVNNKRKICQQITESLIDQNDSAEVALTKKVKTVSGNNTACATSSSETNNPINIKLDFCSLQ